MKKGQSSIEFMVLLGFAILVVSVLLVLLNADAERRIRAQDELVVQELFDLVDGEIRLATISLANYSRAFFIPPTLEGRSYEINISDNRDVVIVYKERQYVNFLNQTIDGDINIGLNTITRVCTSTNICQIEITSS